MTSLRFFEIDREGSGRNDDFKVEEKFCLEEIMLARFKVFYAGGSTDTLVCVADEVFLANT